MLDRSQFFCIKPNTPALMSSPCWNIKFVRVISHWASQSTYFSIFFHLLGTFSYHLSFCRTWTREVTLIPTWCSLPIIFHKSISNNISNNTFLTILSFLLSFCLPLTMYTLSVTLNSLHVSFPAVSRWALEP